MTTLQDAIDVLKFYGDRKNYQGDRYGDIVIFDVEGELAREILTAILDSDATTRRLAEMLLGRVATRRLLEFVRDEITNELNAITLEEMEAE